MFGHKSDGKVVSFKSDGKVVSSIFLVGATASIRQASNQDF